MQLSWCFLSLFFFFFLGLHYLLLYSCSTVALENLWRSNSTRVGGYPELLSVLICSRGLVFAKFQTLKETIIVFTCFVQHLSR